MLHLGNPWSIEEVNILRNGLTTHQSYEAIQKSLASVSHNRSIEAIARKVRRLPPLEIVKIDKKIVLKKQKITWVTGALELKKGQTKFVMLNDVHVPHNIDLTYIWEFISEYKPDYMLLVGDIVNNDPFDHWARATPRKFKAMPKPQEYYELCNEQFYRPLRKAAGKNATVVHWVGNHEYWSNRAIDEMPEGEGFWEVWNNIEEVDLWVPNKQIANLGHLHFVHGDVIAGGRNHSAKMLNYFRRNIRYGHYHNIEETSHTDAIDVKDRHTARCCGTLEKFNPDFMASRPHQWMHAGTYGVVESNGRFYDHTFVITDGKFMANGKIYGPNT